MDKVNRVPKVVVLGAGVNGLSSAVCIKERWPHLDVEIVAEMFSPHTTSDGSGGFWTPYTLGDTSLSLVKELSKITYDYLNALAFTSSGPDAGVQHISGYSLEDKDIKGWEYEDVVDGFRMLQPSEVQRFPNAKSGYFFTTVQVDAQTFLPWLMNKFIQLGGKVRRAKIDSLSEFSGQCDMVVNCCGLGSKELLDDHQMMAVRGQVMRVDAPWIKHFYTLLRNGSDPIYILPGTRQVVVGGTSQRDDWNTTPNEADKDRIWKDATNFMPALKKAKILKEWTGLRPGRSSLRLEREDRNINGQSIKMIHNYGHGGAGLTLFRGCALRVVQMTQDILNLESPIKSKL